MGAAWHNCDERANGCRGKVSGEGTGGGRVEESLVMSVVVEIWAGESLFVGGIWGKRKLICWRDLGHQQKDCMGVVILLLCIQKMACCVL